MKRFLLVALLFSLLILGVTIIWKFSEMAAEKLKNRVPAVLKMDF